MKFFGLEAGRSSGSEASITFDCDGMSEEEVRRAILTEKERLDVLVLTMEYATGGVSSDGYTKIKERVKGAYERLNGTASPGKDGISGDRPS